MKRIILLLLIAGRLSAQVAAPPEAISNWPTANTALTLADPATTNQVAGWDNTAKKFIWVTNGTGGGGFTLPSGTGFLHIATAGTLDGAALVETGTGNAVRANGPIMTNPTMSQGSNASAISAMFGRRFTDASPVGHLILLDNTLDTLQLFRVGVTGEITTNLDANNLTGLKITRQTDTSPTGNFLDFKNHAGASLFTVDITGAWTNPSFTAVTTGNATTSAHGLLPLLDGTATHFLNGSGAWATPAGSGGTVTNTGGNLTANAVVLGAGTTDTKVSTGIVTDGVNAVTLGTAGTNRGSLILSNSASATTTTLRASTSASASQVYEFFDTGGGTQTVASQNWVTGPGTTNRVTGTGFWYTVGSGLQTAAVAAPSGTVVGTSDTQTLTNKRTVPRVTTISSSFSTPTINTDNCDAVTFTGINAPISNMTTNLSGTPNNFDKLIIRLKDNGTARAITSWGNSFSSSQATLPTATVANKTTTVGFIWDSVRLNGASAAGVWSCVAVDQEP